DVDDRPTTRGEHVRYDVLHQFVRGEDGDLEMPAVRGQWRADETRPIHVYRLLFHRSRSLFRLRRNTRSARCGKGGVVDQDADRAERCPGLFDETRNVLSV